ncbi:FecR family protein [Desulfomarina sp.]
MKIFFRLVPFLLFLLLSIQICSARIDPVIGIVKTVKGKAYVTDRTRTFTIQLVPNMKITKGDLIKTEANSSVGLIFEDDTLMSLGPYSEIIIEDFLFDPVNSKLAFVAKMIHGTFSFISGQIARLAPQKVKLETPDATLGIRGTKLLITVD